MYTPKHAIETIKGMSWKARISSGAAVIAVVGGLGVGTAFATTGTPPSTPGTSNGVTVPPAVTTFTASIGNIPVTVSSTADGASAVINPGGTITLTLGKVTATTYAEATLGLPGGSVLPTAVPGFVTSASASGSPRFVITVANGDELMNNQSGTAADTSSPAAKDWSVNTGSGWSNTLQDYADAVTSVGGAGQVVKSAYIVADGDQAPGTADTLSAVSYDGVSMKVKAVTLHPYTRGGHVISVSNNDAVLGWTFGPGVKYVLTQTWGYKMTDSNGNPHFGFTSIGRGYWTGLASGHTYDIEVVPAGSDRQPLPGARIGWINVVTTDSK